MSISPALLPQDCLLCGGGPSRDVLCEACLATLPGAPAPACPVCAEASPGGAVCGHCLKTPPRFDATIGALRYAFPVDKLVQAFKYSHRLALADFFANALLAGSRPTGDLVVPVPLAPSRLRERGFNQALEIARPAARTLDLPLLADACQRSRDTAPQASLPWKERRGNVRRAFECGIDLSGKSVIVVDDVMTTGATLNEFADCLKARGALRVTNWVVARTAGETPY